MAVHKDGNIMYSDNEGNEFEELMAERERLEKQAASYISPEQEVFTDGTKRYFMRPVPMDDQVLIIWGWTWDWEWQKSEWVDLPESEEKAEARTEYQTYKESLTRGYVFTRSFSLFEPSGEFGSHHVSALIPITEEDFHHAENNQWVPDEETKRIHLGFVDRYRAWYEANTSS